MKITGLWIYPIKSCGGIRLDSSQVTPHGLAHDRMFILVDANGVMITQREAPTLCLTRIEMLDHALRVTAPGMPGLLMQLGEQLKAPLVSVTIWDDSATGRDHGDAVAGWFSRYLGAPVRVLRVTAGQVRTHESASLGRSVETGFADAYPVLIVSEESLADLNARLETPLPMNRFRPNIVVSGCRAWEEDEWPSVTLDGLEFQRAKACYRCPIPTINQETAEMGHEPLTTLAKFRKGPSGGVMFGSNYVPLGTGVLRAMISSARA